MTTPEPRNNNDAPLVVIAIGGNSLITDREHMDVLDQYRAAGETSQYIAPIVKPRPVRRVNTSHPSSNRVTGCS